MRVCASWNRLTPWMTSSRMRGAASSKPSTNSTIRPSLIDFSANRTSMPVTRANHAGVNSASFRVRIVKTTGTGRSGHLSSFANLPSASPVATNAVNVDFPLPGDPITRTRECFLNTSEIVSFF